MLRSLCRQQLLPAADNLVTVFSSSVLFQQQARGAKAAAKKKAQPTKGKQQKGKQQPAKKQKQKMDTKPFDEKDTLMQKVIAMLVPPQTEQPAPRTPQQQEELVVRAKQYSRMKMQEHAQWQRDMCIKLKLKKAALQALPPELRAAALQEDLTPFPLTRHFLYDTPPESYRD